MDPVCHRCGTALNSPDELFCPHCGAPQLRYEPTDEPVASISPSLPTGAGRSLDAVSWRAAIISALIVAVPTGLISAMLVSGWLWVVIGGMATLSLYRRRAGAVPTARVGWRVGGVLGILTAFLFTAFFSVRLLVERFVLHSGEVEQQVHAAAMQFADQYKHSYPENAAAALQAAHFITSPDGTAAVVLATAAFSAFTMIVFAAAGGAIGARIASLGKRPQRSSQ